MEKKGAITWSSLSTIEVTSMYTSSMEAFSIVAYRTKQPYVMVALYTALLLTCQSLHGSLVCMHTCYSVQCQELSVRVSLEGNAPTCGAALFRTPRI